MHQLFIPGRAALADALALVDEFGADAPLAAAMRAHKSRDAGNVHRFCHWRQIERLAELLASDRVEGVIH
jgi:hypothetical protein